jgi:hypothetical protein
MAALPSSVDCLARESFYYAMSPAKNTRAYDKPIGPRLEGSLRVKKRKKTALMKRAPPILSCILNARFQPSQTASCGNHHFVTQSLRCNALQCHVKRCQEESWR